MPESEVGLETGGAGVMEDAEIAAVWNDSSDVSCIELTASNTAAVSADVNTDELTTSRTVAVSAAELDAASVTATESQQTPTRDEADESCQPPHLDELGKDTTQPTVETTECRTAMTTDSTESMTTDSTESSVVKDADAEHKVEATSQVTSNLKAGPIDEAAADNKEVKSSDTELGVCDANLAESASSTRRIDWDALEKPRQKPVSEDAELSQVFNKLVKQRSTTESQDAQQVNTRQTDSSVNDLPASAEPQSKFAARCVPAKPAKVSGKTEQAAEQQKTLQLSPDTQVEIGKAVLYADKQTEIAVSSKSSDLSSKSSDLSSHSTSVSSPAEKPSVKTKSRPQQDDPKPVPPGKPQLDDTKQISPSKPLQTPNKPLQRISPGKPLQDDTKPISPGKPMQDDKKPTKLISLNKPTQDDTKPVSPGKPQHDDTKPTSPDKPMQEDTKPASPGKLLHDDTKPASPGEYSTVTSSTESHDDDLSLLSSSKECSDATEVKPPGQDMSKDLPATPKTKPRNDDTSTSPLHSSSSTTDMQVEIGRAVLSAGKQTHIAVSSTSSASKESPAATKPKPHGGDKGPSSPGIELSAAAKTERPSEDMSVKPEVEDISTESGTTPLGDPQTDKKTPSTKKKGSFKMNKGSSPNVASPKSESSTTEVLGSSDSDKLTMEASSPSAKNTASVKKCSPGKAKVQPATQPAVADGSDNKELVPTETTSPCDTATTEDIGANDGRSEEQKSTDTEKADNAATAPQLKLEEPSSGKDQDIEEPSATTSYVTKTVPAQQKKVIPRRTNAKVQPSELKNEEPAWILAAKRKSNLWSEDRAEEFDKKPQKTAADDGDTVRCSCRPELLR